MLADLFELFAGLSPNASSQVLPFNETPTGLSLAASFLERQGGLWAGSFLMVSYALTID